MKKNGFSLIEVIIVIVIISIIAATGGFIVERALSEAFASRDLMEASWQAQLSLTRMSSELREINSTDDLTIPSFPTSTSITFNDINNAVINYSRAGNNLMRNGLILASGITNLAFTYYDNTNNLVTNINDEDQIRCVNIALSVNIRGGILNLSTLVCPRNLLW